MIYFISSATLDLRCGSPAWLAAAEQEKVKNECSLKYWWNRERKKKPTGPKIWLRFVFIFLGFYITLGRFRLWGFLTGFWLQVSVFATFYCSLFCITVSKQTVPQKSANTLCFIVYIYLGTLHQLLSGSSNGIPSRLLFFYIDWIAGTRAVWGTQAGSCEGEQRGACPGHPQGARPPRPQEPGSWRARPHPQGASLPGLREQGAALTASCCFD